MLRRLGKPAIAAALLAFGAGALFAATGAALAGVSTPPATAAQSRPVTRPLSGGQDSISHVSRSGIATTVLRASVPAPGRYYEIVVGLRARHHAEHVTVYLTGQPKRFARASPRTPTLLHYFNVKLTSAQLAVLAVSSAPAVHLSLAMTLEAHPPSPPTTPTPTQTSTSTSTSISTTSTTTTSTSTTATAPGWTDPYQTNGKLVWADEFSGATGSQPDPAKWASTGNSGCGGGVYTHNQASNATLDGAGHLAIAANRSGSGFTGDQIDTVGKYSMSYGSVQASIALPPGDALCSAFWMVGNGSNPPAACWPGCGEVDILEALSNLPNTAVFTLHGPGGHNNFQQFESTASPGNLESGFHTYGVVWTPTSITWTIDGNPYASETKAALIAANGPSAWVYNAPFHIILDLTVGNWQQPNPDAPGLHPQFPARMLVDWVRVYQ